MNKKAIIFGLVTVIGMSSIVPVYAAEANEDVPNKKETKVEAKQESSSMSLNKAIEYALENSKDMEIQRLELDKAQVVYTQNIRSVKSAEKAMDDADDISYPRTYEVTADQNVNNALITNGVSRKSVELAYQVAKWNVDKKENEIKYNVEKAYYDLSHIVKELEIAKENLELSKKQYEQGKLRYELGTISNQELLGMEIGLYQAQGAYDTAEMYYDLQEMSFKSTIGYSLSKKGTLVDTVEYKEHEAINLNSSIKSALENNVGIKALEGNNEVAELTLKAVSGRYPQGTYKYKEQEVVLKQAAKNLESAKVGIEMSVRSAVLNLQNAEEQIATYKKAIEQAQKALEITEKSFELGRSTSNEVIQANIGLMNAKKNLSQQIHAYNLALVDYEYSIGIGK